MSELKACQCGGKLINDEFLDMWRVECKCGAKGRLADSEEDAAKYWNAHIGTRPAEQEKYSEDDLKNAIWFTMRKVNKCDAEDCNSCYEYTENYLRNFLQSLTKEEPG